MTMRLLLSVGMLSCLSACGGTHGDPARSDLNAVLADSIGKAARPNASYLGDRSHLLIDVGSDAFSGLASYARAAKAREIAALSLRNYAHRSEVDSVRVQGSEPKGPGVRKIFWGIDFAAKDLGTK